MALVKRRALILASQKEAEWHPFDAVREAFLSALSGDFTCVEAVDRVPGLEELAGCSLLVNLLDVWKEPVSEELVALLKPWIAQGGGFLSVHQGISLARDERLLPLLGARFDGHPPLCRLNFHADSSLRFSLDEEGYRSVPAPGVLCEIVLSYSEAADGEESADGGEMADGEESADGGEMAVSSGAAPRLPGGWFVEPPARGGLDAILPVRRRQSAWFMPGHTASSFLEPAAAGILAEMALSCAAASGKHPSIEGQ